MQMSNVAMKGHKIDKKSIAAIVILMGVVLIATAYL